MHGNGGNFIYEIKHAGDRQMDKFVLMKKFWPHRVVCCWRKAINKDTICMKVFEYIPNLR